MSSVERSFFFFSFFFKEKENNRYCSESLFFKGVVLLFSSGSNEANDRLQVHIRKRVLNTVTFVMVHAKKCTYLLNGRWDVWSGGEAVRNKRPIRIIVIPEHSWGASSLWKAMTAEESKFANSALFTLAKFWLPAAKGLCESEVLDTTP